VISHRLFDAVIWKHSNVIILYIKSMRSTSRVFRRAVAKMGNCHHREIHAGFDGGPLSCTKTNFLSFLTVLMGFIASTTAQRSIFRLFFYFLDSAALF
jgi:hypothetical protein